MMVHSRLKDQKILITGGTSGLGFELVRLFLRHGYHVVTTGRQQVKLPGFDNRLSMYKVDFSSLKKVAEVTERICSEHTFRFIVNNAGILSPPIYTETDDGFEYTLQINFLAHLLIDEIIISGARDEKPVRIASVTSPVYRFAAINPEIESVSTDYRAFRSYSASKLYLAMMSEILSARHGRTNLECFSYNPGTFSSGIYRMQSGWFRQMYRIASPFMRRPARVAGVLKNLILNDNIINGALYDFRNRQRSLPASDIAVKETFIASCYKMIDPYLN
jgi:NAD(P)-dependent dehydrogenase (short-subunit alcohol dehydrogenase family)